MKINILKKAILFFVLILFSSFVFSSSWQMFRGNIHREGSKYEVLIPSLTPCGWDMGSFYIQAEIVGSPVVKNDVVYFGSRDGSVWALNALTGEILWQYSTAGGVDSTAVVWDGLVFIISRDGKVYCFKDRYNEDEDCIPVWSFDTESNSCSSPLVVDNKLYFVSGPKLDGRTDGGLYVLNIYNGELVKKINLPIFGYSTISYDNGKIFFTTSDGFVRCYDIEKDLVVWGRKNMSNFMYTSIVAKDNVLYYYSGGIEKKLYAVNANTGAEKWSWSLNSSVATENSSVAVFENNVVVNIFPTSMWSSGAVKYSSQTVVCLRKSDGSLVWRKDFAVEFLPKDSYGTVSAPIVVNNVIFFGGLNGKLYALNLNDATEIVSYNFGSAIVNSIAVSNGWLYFGTVDGNFYGIKGEKFLSVKMPDENDVVINNTPIVVSASGFEGEGYKIQYSVDGDNWSDIISGSLSEGTTAVGVWDTTGLLDGSYKLKKGIISNTTFFAINNIIIDNSPLPPVFLTGFVVSENKVSLSWTKSADDGSGNRDVREYEIYRSTSETSGFYKLVSVSSGVVNYTDEVSKENTYYYKICAVDKRSKSLFSPLAGVYVPATISFTEETTANIGSSGGTIKLNLADGKFVELSFPSECVSGSIVVSISIEKEFNDNMPSGVMPTSLVYRISFSDNVILSKPAELKINYKDTDVSGLEKERLRIYWYDESSGLWRVVDTSQSDVSNNIVVAKIYQGGKFRVAQVGFATDKILLEEYVYTFPSPAKGDEINFKFIVYQPAEIKIYVYTINGNLIWESKKYEYTTYDIGKTQVVRWNIRDIASGMYIFRVEAKNTSKTQQVIKKLAVIH